MSALEILGVVGLVIIALAAIGTLFGYIDWSDK